MPATAAEREQVEREVRDALCARILQPSLTTDLAHGILLVLAVVLCWGRLTPLATAGWVIAVLAATITRGAVRYHARTRQSPTEQALRLVRLSVGAQAVAWGVGAGAAAPDLPFPAVALLLVLFTGLVSGAVTTLTPDLKAGRLFVGGLAIPLAVGVGLNGAEREHIVSLVMIGIYSLFILLQMQRGHANLAEYYRVQALLRRSETTAVRERAYVDALLNSAPVGIVTVDARGKIRRVNPAFEHLFGYASGDVVGRHLDETIVPPEERAGSADLRRRVTEGGTVSGDVRRRRKDGTLVDVRVSASRVTDAGDAELFALYEDVTTQVAARRAIEEARDAAEHAARARATFLANMSHEIRTPMNAILGFTELLLESELSPEQRHSLSLVQSSAETLLTLIDDILDFSKIEGDHLQLESVQFDLRHLVESTAGLLGVRARQKRLEVLAHVAPGVPAAVRGDPTRLRQVLTNLVGNAIKFTHQGEVVLAVAPAGRDGARARARFAVRDTGIGIAADKLETIFAEFSQADASMTRRYGGTGLGLAIARRLVRLMGGELTVTSEEGKGTEFAFTVAFDVDHSGPVTAPHPSATHLAGRRALIVDDSATNRHIVREMLATAGMRSVEAERGDAALDMIRRARHEGAPYDLVIVDQQMPVMDGFSLASALRADRALHDTRLLMLTSAGQRGDGQRCRELGIRGYLTKPASRSDLLEAAAAVVSATGPGGQAPPEIVTRHSIAESRPRLRILIAEDNPVNQEVAATILRRRGHHVELAGDGRAAVEAVAAAPYDAVLMDIQMPVMDGFEATAAIRATAAGRDLPIIALTAHAQRGEREHCLASGMSAYLTKPFKAHELFALVEGWADEQAPDLLADPEPETAAPAAVDVEAFRRSMRAAGAEDAVPGILKTFLETAPARMAELEAAVAGHEAGPIRRAAHAYKSAAGAIAASALAGRLDELEAAARRGELTGLQASLDGIRTAHTAVMQQLEHSA